MNVYLVHIHYMYVRFTCILIYVRYTHVSMYVRCACLYMCIYSCVVYMFYMYVRCTCLYVCMIYTCLYVCARVSAGGRVSSYSENLSHFRAVFEEPKARPRRAWAEPKVTLEFRRKYSKPTECNRHLYFIFSWSVGLRKKKKREREGKKYIFIHITQGSTSAFTIF